MLNYNHPEQAEEDCLNTNYCSSLVIHIGQFVFSVIYAHKIGTQLHTHDHVSFLFCNFQQSAYLLLQFSCKYLERVRRTTPGSPAYYLGPIYYFFMFCYHLSHNVCKYISSTYTYVKKIVFLLKKIMKSPLLFIYLINFI